MSHDKDYTDYINSDAWFSVRELAFNHHGRFCKKCGGTNRLHVHHKTYRNFKKEDVENDLVPLCRGCHKGVHALVKKRGLPLLEGTDLYLSKVKRTKKQLKRRIKEIKSARRRLHRKNYSDRQFNAPKHHGTFSKVVLGNTERKPKEKGKIDIQKFTAMYGIDEETARSFIK